MNRRRSRRRRRRKAAIAYIMRTVIILMAIITVILIICCCRYLFGGLSENDKQTDYGAFAYEEVASDGQAEEDTVPVTFIEDEEEEICVVIDAGHGGSDGGTVSGDVIEKDINLSVALKLQAILEANDIKVIMTRSYDDKVSLSQRTAAANDFNADFFISLHCNYYEDDNRVAGLECYYISPEDEESKAYAESIINALSQSDEVKVRSAKAEEYYVLEHTKMPAVLVEMGFLSNASECQKLLDEEYQEELAQKIAEGILQELMAVSPSMASAEHFHAIPFLAGGFPCTSCNC